MHLPTSMSEWNEFAEEFNDSKSGIVLAAVGGPSQREDPFAACAGSYPAVIVSVSALVLNIASSVGENWSAVLDDIESLLKDASDHVKAVDGYSETTTGGDNNV